MSKAPPESEVIAELLGLGVLLINKVESIKKGVRFLLEGAFCHN